MDWISPTRYTFSITPSGSSRRQQTSVEWQAMNGWNHGWQFHIPGLELNNFKLHRTNSILWIPPCLLDQTSRAISRIEEQTKKFILLIIYLDSPPRILIFPRFLMNEFLCQHSVDRLFELTVFLPQHLDVVDRGVYCALQMRSKIATSILAQVGISMLWYYRDFSELQTAGN